MLSLSLGSGAVTADTPAEGRLRSILTDPPTGLARIVRVVTGIELAIGAVALLLIFFLVLTQAAQRYLPIDGLPWAGELAKFSLVWLTFVVAGVLVSRDAHISIEMVDSVSSLMLQRVVRVIACLIVAATGVALTAEAWELIQTQGLLKSPAMRMPMSWLYAISMIGFVSTTVRATFAALEFAVLGVPESDDDELPQVGAL
jgi:TRAP-type C4-dicarboxylate transport system permease small subunit